jgi:hypothetical protein
LTMNRAIATITVFLGVIAGACMITAGWQLKSAGGRLTELRSVGGTSVAEAYYQEVGRLAIAASPLAYGFGLGTISVSIGIGGLLWIRQKTLSDALPTP